MSGVTVIRHVPPPIIGVCPTAPDHRFQELEAELDWLEVNGVEVERIDPEVDTRAVEELADAFQLWQAHRAKALPMIVVDGHVESHGRFPSRHELAHLVATRHAAGSLRAVRHVAAVAAAAAVGDAEEVIRERAAATAVGLDTMTLDIAEDVGRHAGHGTR
jgi:hypothetical protein